MDLNFLICIVYQGFIGLSKLKLVISHGFVNGIVNHSKIISESDFNPVDWTFLHACL